MGHIRTRKETGKLYIDFKYQNLRCREQTAMLDTPVNRKKLETLLARIDAEILLGSFDYQAYFPESRMLKKIKLQQNIIDRHISGVPTFNEFFNIWYSEVEVGWRRSYKRTILGLINYHLIPAFGEMMLNEIFKPELLQFRAQLTKVRKINNDCLSIAYVNRIMKIFKMIVTEAADRYEFNNPFRGIKPLKAVKPQIEPFSLDEVNQIISNVRDDFKSYYTVRFFTGMRTGEIDGLKWQYVDFDKRQICIRETIVNGYIEYTKTDSSQREILMSQPVYDALKEQYKMTGQHKYVFCTKKGEPFNYNNITKRIWQPILNYLGLKVRRAYQTRHTAATLWLASGENPEWIARQMGHANTEMLFKVYSRYVPNLTRQDGSAFERLLLKNNSDS